jgi:chemotaxis protein MotB
MVADAVSPQGAWLRRRPQAARSGGLPVIVVNGYTDNLPVGPELRAQGITSNLDLSSKRADTVVQYLVSQGVNPNLVSAQGFGDTNPIAPNDTPEGRAKNRRIEITLVGPGT